MDAHLDTITQEQNATLRELAKCCCEQQLLSKDNLAAIERLGAQIARDFCSLENNLSNQIRDNRDATRDATDKLSAEMRDLDTKHESRFRQLSDKIDAQNMSIKDQRIHELEQEALVVKLANLNNNSNNNGGHHGGGH